MFAIASAGWCLACYGQTLLSEESPFIYWTKEATWLGIKEEMAWSYACNWPLWCPPQFWAVIVKLPWATYFRGCSPTEKSLQRSFPSLYSALPGKFLPWGPTCKLFIFVGRTPRCQYFGLFTSEWVERQWTNSTSLPIKDGQWENKALAETCQDRNDLRWWLHGYKSFIFWQMMSGFLQLWLEITSKKF